MQSLTRAWLCFSGGNDLVLLELLDLITESSQKIAALIVRVGIDCQEDNWLVNLKQLSRSETGLESATFDVDLQRVRGTQITFNQQRIQLSYADSSRTAFAQAPLQRIRPVCV